MADTTITAANSIFTIAASSLFPAPVQLEGYSSDKAFATDALELAEINMGVDGRMTAGYVPNPVNQTVVLQADSPSRAIFNAIIAATKVSGDVFYLTGLLSLPSTGEKFTLTRGILRTVKQIPDANKVLQPVDYVITWQSVDPAPL
jgi:hypothetical protein